MSTVRLRWLLVPAAAAAGLAGFWLAQQLDRETPVLASGTWLPQPRPIADFELDDASGRPFTRERLEGAPTLVYFGFTRCPDICPTTLAKLAQVRRTAALPAVRVLFVSIDPGRDTPAAARRYAQAFDPAFEGASGSPAEILKVARSFAVAVNRVELPGGDYTMDHSAVIFLVAAGGIAAIFTPPFEVPALVTDLRRAVPYLERRRGKRAT